MQRPPGITVLVFLLGFLALGAFVLTLTAETLAELNVRWQLVRLGALVYGLTAVVAAIGLWKLRRWAFVAFLAWVIVVISLGIWWPVVFPSRSAPWWTAFLWMALAAAVLIPIARYVRRVVSPESPSIT